MIRKKAFLLASLLGASFIGSSFLMDSGLNSCEAAQEDVVTLRVCNWEEYIDLGDWDEEEQIDLDNGVSILGENALYEDFEEWYYETTGQRVQVEYSCFGTNEDLYNQLNIGDKFDLICPSDYLIMKLMSEKRLVPFSEQFFDESIETNYYVKGVSPFIRETFENNEIGGEPWMKYAAGYMWGVTGNVYNPEVMTKEEASTMTVFENPKFERRLTLKDNVRDTYFVTLGMYYKNLLESEEFRSDEDYREELAKLMNDVSKTTIDESEKILQPVVQSIYSLETDSGKADMISGKVYASYQWSGDAVYAMDQAEEDDFILNFAVPREVTNLWFDGWIMLKDGLVEDERKQQAAEAFVNYLSRPDNAVRNMYYIGYSSVISGGDDDTVFEYINWNYSSEEADAEYPLGYFFSGISDDEDYVIYCDSEQLDRQLAAQYPSKEVMRRAAIMGYYDEEETKNINQMWINVRCFNVNRVPGIIWRGLVGIILLDIIWIWYRKRQKRMELL